MEGDISMDHRLDHLLKLFWSISAAAHQSKQGLDSLSTRYKEILESIIFILN